MQKILPLHVADRKSIPSFEFVCGVRWDEMDAGVNADVKHCGVCDRTIHLCRTVAEFDQHARAGHCVAVHETGCFAGISETPSPPSRPSPPSTGPTPPLPPAGPSRLWDEPPSIPTAGMPHWPDADEKPSDPGHPTIRAPQPSPPPLPPDV